MKILIVEDEIVLCDAIAEGLEIDGYIVEKSYDGEDALEKILVEIYDLIILDLNLPYIDGIDIIKKARKNNIDVKILILSARSDVADKVVGLNVGANDYLTKPFDFLELEARVQNLVRRRFIQEDTIIKLEDIVFDCNKRELVINNIIVTLTKKELSIFEYLILNRDKTISQEELIEHSWDMNADLFSSSVRVHISSLRKKIKDILGYDLIKTKIGEGYYLYVEKS